MDTTIDSGQSASDPNELPVLLDTLELAGTRPVVGDSVKITVTGKVIKIVNETAIVRPELANGQPIPQPPPADELDELAQASEGVMLGTEY